VSGRTPLARTPWFVTPFVATITLLGLQGLVDMVSYTEWIWVTAGVLGAVALAIMITRMLSRSRALPTFVGLAAAVLVSIPAFSVNDEGVAQLWPSPTGLRGLGQALADGVDEALATVPPADPERPLVALITVGALLVFLVAEHLAVSWRAAAFAGAILLTPWIPAIALQHRVSVSLLLLALGLWIVTMALTRRPTGASSGPAPLAGAASAMAAVLLTVLVAPSALGANGWGLIPRLTTPQDLQTAPRLNLALDLRNSLTVNTSSTVAAYVTTGERPDALRMYTLTRFDGNAWEDDVPQGLVPTETPPLWPTPVPDWGTRDLDRVTMTVMSSESSVPLPPVPRGVEGLGPEWLYDPIADQVVSSSSTTQGLEYSITADFGYLTSAMLQGADAGADDATLDPETLALPESADRELYASVAQGVTQGATNRYDQAVALQEYFRSTGGFVYDTTVQPTGSDSVAVFLEEQRGYCVQFATSMVMMSRTLGIPARLAVGYLPGSEDSSGASIVRGGDAHAWPELYFAGVGWVRFEPTPSVQTGARPSYTQADSSSPEDPTVEDPAATAAPANPAQDPTDPLEVPSSQQDEEQSSGLAVPWPLVGLFAALAIAAIVGARWLARRRDIEADRANDPEIAWAWLRRRVPAAFQWPLTLTPFEAVAHVRDVAIHDELEISDAALHAIDSLATAVSDARYAPREMQSEWEGLDTMAEEARSGLAIAAKGRPARVGAQDAPRRGA